MNEIADGPINKNLIAETPISAETPFQRFLSEFFDSRVAISASVALSIIIFIAVFAPLISPQNPIYCPVQMFARLIPFLLPK